jgi:hypothetical protein
MVSATIPRTERSLKREALGVLGVPVGVLTMFVSRRRVILGVLMLRVAMGSHEVVVGGCVMVGCDLMMMLH